MLMKTLLLLVGIATIYCQGPVGVAKETDWRITGYISPVIDQGGCQAGWATAATTLYEFWYAKESGQGNGDLSDGYILDCSQQGGCGNGSLLGAVNYLVANGTATQSSFGNEDIYSGFANSSRCTGSTGQTITYAKVTATLYVNKWFKISSSKLKKIVAQAPTANEIYVDNNFTYYNGYEWPYKCKTNVKRDIELNHAVVVVGYDKHSNFYLKNSKGTSWGKDGYMLIKKNKDCGLRRRVYQMYTSKNTSATTTMGVFGIRGVGIGLFLTATALAMI
jgi:C1A family cysteine protease